MCLVDFLLWLLVVVGGGIVVVFVVGFFQAGHMVPEYRPKEAFTMFLRYLSNTDL